MLQVVPIQKLEEERIRMAPVETIWGIFCCLAVSRSGGWVVIENGMVKEVKLGSGDLTANDWKAKCR
jgi:hypothetical protein